MFEQLTGRLSQVVRQWSGKGRLTEDNIQDALREVRLALLEADVALPVVKVFIEDVQTRAIGQEVQDSLSPGQAFIKVVHEALIALMTADNQTLNLQAPAPLVILLAGLQGSGKTTTTAKLARFLKEKHRKEVLVASVDVYRPAAIEQLAVLAEEVGVLCYTSSEMNPIKRAQEALQSARVKAVDVLLIDTAGRLHIDETMMQEVKSLHAAVVPIETLFVVDGLTGQDAAKTAEAFNQALPLTGVILTKMDGDARGGAALSVRHITGKPIKFLGMGERVAALEPFHPERVASRILGMGDVLSLIEDIETRVDRQKAEDFAKKLQKGKGFDLGDFREQLRQMMNMGGVAALLEKMPGLSGMPQALAKTQVNDKSLKHLEAMINSMTPQERRFPSLIKGSRKRRIAEGSGRQVQEVNRLLKQFEQAQKVMKKVSRGGNLKNLLRGLQVR